MVRKGTQFLKRISNGYQRAQLDFVFFFFFNYHKIMLSMDLNQIDPNLINMCVIY